MALKDLDIVVVGAGIGGLATALALRQTGARVRVLEQAVELSEIGAGLQISANGMVVLRALGVVPQGSGGPGVRSDGTIIRDYRTGRRVTTLPPPTAGPTYYFHRADLIDLLHSAAERAGVDLVLAQQVASYDARGGQPSVETVDGQVHLANLVIAADGGRSRLRDTLAGPGAPRFTGQVAWRATISGQNADLDPRAVLTMGPGRHIVTYPLRGGRQTNIVAVEERTDWREEGWRHQGDPEDLKRRFSGFGGEVAEQLAAVKAVHLWALFLHPVASRWQDGRLALVGDAAHPTLPFMAQGACLALEDAWVLARSLSQTGDPATGLTTYEATRKHRAQRVVAAASANARNFHYKSPMRQLAQLGLIALGPRIARRYDWIYAHDVTR
ncbi:FAD-dependent monooxygenase [Sedimentitalea todarodis]|uniref:FAD-dependent monooxygenase n=1 Tax=Sedimentitalea todarodis TaxID=1631240 RepID=A0ABU3VCC8_9RHOB|nr:FAD-dependent monooxygenase [Sedimentitalea todarodis]MDU9003828.1 FAD-dependent monooxygenase [Sedimentitalea todarodis]